MIKIIYYLTLFITNIALASEMSSCRKFLSEVEESFVINEIVPDVVDKAPSGYIEVTYPNEVKVQLGNELLPSQVEDEPEVRWEATGSQLYLLAMVDPDAPSRQNRMWAEGKHWIVANIPGNDVISGDTLTTYKGSAPPKDTGLHRYVFLVYKQSSKIDFEKLKQSSSSSRAHFSISKFAKMYNLEDPIAGNFYQSQFQ